MGKMLTGKPRESLIGLPIFAPFQRAPHHRDVESRSPAAPQINMAAANLKLIEETFTRLTSLPGVLGVLICTTDGIPIRTTFEPQLAIQYAALTLNVSQVARRTVKQLSHASYGEVEQDQKKASAGRRKRRCCGRRELFGRANELSRQAWVTLTLYV